MWLEGPKSHIARWSEQCYNSEVLSGDQGGGKPAPVPYTAHNPTCIGYGLRLCPCPAKCCVEGASP